MSQENVEIVRRLNDVFNERSFVENADLLDPDMVWDMSHVPLPDAAIFTGRLGLLEFLDAWTESFASEHIDAEEILTAVIRPSSWSVTRGNARPAASKSTSDSRCCGPCSTAAQHAWTCT